MDEKLRRLERAWKEGNSDALREYVNCLRRQGSSTDDVIEDLLLKGDVDLNFVRQALFEDYIQPKVDELCDIVEEKSDKSDWEKHMHEFAQVLYLNGRGEDIPELTSSCDTSSLRSSFGRSDFDDVKKRKKEIEEIESKVDTAVKEAAAFMGDKEALTELLKQWEKPKFPLNLAIYLLSKNQEFDNTEKFIQYYHQDKYRHFPDSCKAFTEVVPFYVSAGKSEKAKELLRFVVDEIPHFAREQRQLLWMDVARARLCFGKRFVERYVRNAGTAEHPYRIMQLHNLIRMKKFDPVDEFIEQTSSDEEINYNYHFPPLLIRRGRIGQGIQAISDLKQYLPRQGIFSALMLLGAEKIGTKGLTVQYVQ